MGKISYLRTLLVAVAAFAFVACSDDKNGNDLPDGGVTEKDCSNTKSVTGGAGSFKITFTAVGDWEAVSSDDSWLTIVPADGGKGSNKITVSFTQNTAATSRRGTVAIRVSGYRDAVLCTLTQSGAGSGSDTAVNEWIEEYMKEAYLWNEAIDQVALDNTVSFKEYLKSILDGVAAQKDASGRPVNYDDGYWENGVRQEYYSYIELNEQSRSTRAGETYNDTGILNVISGYLQEEPYIGGLVIMGVAPGSSADEAGLKRGHMVTEVDGVKYTKNLSADVKQNMFMKLVQGNNVRIVANEVSVGDNGDWVLTPLPEMTLSSFSYVDPAIYKQDVVDIDGRKVAYLLYMGFSRAYDEDLFEAFDRFKAEGAEELVLDLRYNGGGEVLSSTLLATLIAGQEYKGQVYVKTTYNASRTAAGQTGALYKIGESVVSGSDSSYSLIAEALNHSLGLKHRSAPDRHADAGQERRHGGIREPQSRQSLLRFSPHHVLLGECRGLQGLQRRIHARCDFRRCELLSGRLRYVGRRTLLTCGELDQDRRETRGCILASEEPQHGRETTLQSGFPAAASGRFAGPARRAVAVRFPKSRAAFPNVALFTYI